MLLEDEVKEIFLTALREPLQTTLAVLDLSTSTIDQVIDWVLDMDQAHIGNHMVMGALQRKLPKEEDL